jgi:uncharacterized protein (DUF1684 family)
MEHDHDHEHEHGHEHGHEHHKTEHHHRPEPATYEEEITSFRADKDAYFRDDHDSPLLPEDRPNFKGIAYFPPEEFYVVEGLRLDAPASDEEKSIHIPTSDGQVREARRIGQLRFSLDGNQLSLHAYGLPGMHGGSLFVPFLDATSGHETYEAGRYLDLEPEDDGSYTLDFNLAYHPTCVFSPYFSCPLTPEENRLPIRIEAGEQLTPGIGGH